MTITMQGHARRYETPARLGQSAAFTAWELTQLHPDVDAQVRGWADRILTGLVAAATGPAVDALDCTDCDDTGWYGLPDPDDPDTLTALLRRHGDGHLQLAADGRWVTPDGRGRALELLDETTAQDLAGAVLAGATLTRRYFMPAAFLPPTDLRTPSPHPAGLLAAAAAPAAPVEQSPTDDGHDWLSYAVVDPLDTGAVLQVIRLRPGPIMQRYDTGGVWVPDPPVLASLTGLKPPPLVELDPDTLTDVLQQVDSGAADEEPAATTAAGGNAETLRRYWSTGKGGAKIRWGTPGSWTRCYKYLREYLGQRAKGYCQNMHKRNTGTYAGSKANRASAAPMMMMSPEQSLLAALAAGTWAGSSAPMTATAELRDAIYEAVTPVGGPVIRSLVAGAFPDVPPAEWFDDPRLSEVTPTVVEESGRVYGHLADWNTAHIGLANDIRTPRSSSNYRYFNRGALPVMAAGGTRSTVTVGQLTLVGGHAPMSADAGQAVKHYDDTDSAIADVHVGEDAHGIWFAGALRSSVTPDRLRAFCASCLSGDWRPINGGLELVAACSVNVPGFPIARARVAGGAVMSLVAAGALGVAEKGLRRHADASLLSRLDRLESEVVALRASYDTPVLDAAAVLDGVQLQAVPGTEDEVPPAVEGGVVPAGEPVEVIVQEGETVTPQDTVPATDDEAPAEGEDDDEPATDEVEVPPAVQRAREKALQRRANVLARARRTSPEVEYERLIAASAAPVVAAFKFEDWMAPMGADGQVVKTGARVAVASATDESVAVAKVVDVTRSGIKVKWVAGGRAGTSTIKGADIGTLVRTSVASDSGKSEEGSSDPKAPAPSDGAGAVEAVAASAVPAAVARARRTALLAAFNKNQLRDNRGRFIEMGAVVNVKQDDGSERRGKVVQLTGTGPKVEYDDDKSVEIVLAADTTDRIEQAPDAKAELPGKGGAAGGDSDELPQGAGGLSDEELMSLRDAADDAGNVKQKAVLQKLMDARHDDALAGPGVPTPPKPSGVTDEQWKMSLLDRKYARDNNLPEPTAKQARDYKADYDAAVADLAKQNARRKPARR